MPARRPLLITVSVLAGLAICVSLVLLVVADPSDPLPGIALGSALILAVERTVVLFAAWMLVLVVVARALRGELPTEISGRGVRYADAEGTERAVADSRAALSRLDFELEELWDAVSNLEKKADML